MKKIDTHLYLYVTKWHPFFFLFALRHTFAMIIWHLPIIQLPSKYFSGANVLPGSEVSKWKQSRKRLQWEKIWMEVGNQCEEKDIIK